jgi:hypothetical protein
VFPIAIFGCLLYDNLLVVIGQFVENVLDLLIELELVEFRHAVGGDGDSVLASCQPVRLKISLMQGLARQAASKVFGGCRLGGGGGQTLIETVPTQGLVDIFWLCLISGKHTMMSMLAVSCSKPNLIQS